MVTEIYALGIIPAMIAMIWHDYCLSNIRQLKYYDPVKVLSFGLLSWLGVSLTLWFAYKRHRERKARNR